MLSGSSCDFLGNNGLPDWCKSDSCQFQVLDGKWDANDRAEAQDRRDDMTDGKPDASKDEPDAVADHAKANRATIASRFNAESQIHSFADAWLSRSYR